MASAFECGRGKVFDSTSSKIVALDLLVFFGRMLSSMALLGIIALFVFFLQRLLDVLLFAVFARVIFSWFPAHNLQENRIYGFLHDVTEPMFVLVQKLPHRFGMIDISPIYVFIMLNIISQVLNIVAASFISSL